ncbi:Ada metal-binding domain-containing protein [Bradyrhizobium sp. 177]
MTAASTRRIRTTRIYCRPVCPVKQPLTRNVRWTTVRLLHSPIGSG